MFSEIVLATQNKHKIAEFEELLVPLNIKVLSVKDYPGIPEVVEDGDTFEENALKKAKAVALATGKPALSDDSGLLVDALNNLPGVHSARYAGEQASSVDNLKKLINELSNKGTFPFKARFKTVLCLVINDSNQYFTGVCEGVIIRDGKGRNGFGYDPVFIPNGFNETFAEMSSAKKNAISHRAKAVAAFMSYLKEN